MAVAGASRFLTSSTLANKQGLPAQRPQLLGAGSAQNLLDAAKSAGSVEGIGLSSQARALNNKFLRQTASQGVGLFGLSSGASLTTQNLATQIKALRSSVPKSQISDLVLAAEKAKQEEDAEASEKALIEEAKRLVKNRRGRSLDEYQQELEEAIRILKARQEVSLTNRSASFRRGLTLDEQA